MKNLPHGPKYRLETAEEKNKKLADVVVETSKLNFNFKVEARRGKKG